MLTAITTLWIAVSAALFIASAIAIFKIVKVSDKASSKSQNFPDHIFFVLMIFGFMSVVWAWPFMLLFFLVPAFRKEFQKFMTELIDYLDQGRMKSI